MTEEILSGKKVAKNTLFLYIRMSIVMLITLYTSRVIFVQLGIEDYGIYNVVAGFVTMFSFFMSSLSNATQRFLNYELGRRNVKQTCVIFNTSFWVFIIISVIMFLLIETIGLWFLCNKMVIPTEKLNQAIIVLHLSAITTLVNVIGCVYCATIMAHENMKIYAFTGILEAFLRLLIAMLLTYSSMNKLVFYAFLYMLVTITIQIVYVVYCSICFPECKLRGFIAIEKDTLKKISTFLGWNTIIGFVDILNQQGINVLLNLFFGPIVNAARGISFQINNAVQSFGQNIYVATRPQLVKAYSSKNVAYFIELFYKSSKYSFYLMMIICIPLIIKIDYILELWMGDVPQYTNIFSVLIIIYLLINSLNNPIWAAVQANGNLKQYSIIGSVIFISNIPLSYILFKFDFPPYSAFVCYIFIRLIYLIISLRILTQLVENINSMEYVNKVLFPIVFTAVLVFFVNYIISIILNTHSFLFFMIELCIYIIVTIAAIWMIGIDKKEREVIKNIIISKLSQL